MAYKPQSRCDKRVIYQIIGGSTPNSRHSHECRSKCSDFNARSLLGKERSVNADVVSTVSDSNTGDREKLYRFCYPHNSVLLKLLHRYVAK